MHRVLLLLFWGIIISLIKLVHWLMAHETIFKLSERKINYIMRNGLVHYTSREKAKKIMDE